MTDTQYREIRFKLRRGTIAEWEAENPTLLDGEPGIEELIDGTERLKFGDGETPWNDLDYFGVGGAGDTTPYIHEQGTPSADWVVDHNLGYEPPAIEVTDSAGNHWVGTPEYVTLNRLIIHFSAAFGGRARVR